MEKLNEMKALNYRQKQDIYKKILDNKNAKSYGSKRINFKSEVLEQRILENIQLVNTNFKTDKQIINELMKRLQMMEEELRKMRMEKSKKRSLRRKLIHVTG